MRGLAMLRSLAFILNGMGIYLQVLSTGLI